MNGRTGRHGQRHVEWELEQDTSKVASSLFAINWIIVSVLYSSFILVKGDVTFLNLHCPDYLRRFATRHGKKRWTVPVQSIVSSGFATELSRIGIWIATELIETL